LKPWYHVLTYFYLIYLGYFRSDNIRVYKNIINKYGLAKNISPHNEFGSEANLTAMFIPENQHTKADMRANMLIY
jgi:hypothetical protein